MRENATSWHGYFQLPSFDQYCMTMLTHERACTSSDPPLSPRTHDRACLLALKKKKETHNLVRLQSFTDCKY